MKFTGKTALVAGLARSGVSAAKLLYRLGARVIVNDIKKEAELEDLVTDLKSSIDCEFVLGIQPDEAAEQADLIVLSPGVPTDLPYIIKARKSGKEVIGEIELAYRLCKAPIAAITGTNGKTTTTALVGEIFKAAGLRTHVLGNIGVPFTGSVMDILPTDAVSAEISSYQLETIDTFKPKVAVILNITEDHLNRHKTMEKYIEAKLSITRNQDEDDSLVINADDKILSEISLDTKARIFRFSRKQVLSAGAWVEDNEIIVDIGKGRVKICEADEVAIPGAHNLENALAAALAASLMGVRPEAVSTALRTFPGVEHRIEKVDTIDGVTFYNDSKGTNPDAAIKAIEAMKGPTVLIAGGYDKHNTFDEFIQAFGDKVRAMVVLGETAEKIATTAKQMGFTEVYRVKSIEEAVNTAFKLSSPGYNVLLSPACASWDMFRDFEERGRVFKEAVKALRG
ncbi:MAG TPA: UDP-N-acetylmuramoyl-L-alanine--D-glutamate ligase [Candidatus Atribacteria bacterium]|nr:UDP-N-acetylmuramoyl-L-alanine--D-glutamate ligase [Candidatus Atribacteria bacterium]